MGRKRFGKVIAALALIVGVVVMNVPSSSAQLAVPYCNGAGNLFASPQPDGSVLYGFNGTARCGLGTAEGPYIAEFTGEGRAARACVGTLPIALGFTLDVTMVARSVTGSATIVEGMAWKLLVTTYPQVTPFLVFQNAAGNDAGNQLRGAGNIFSARTACQGAFNQSGVLFDLAWLNF